MKFEFKDGVIWANPDKEEEIPDVRVDTKVLWELIKDIQELIESTEEV